MARTRNTAKRDGRQRQATKIAPTTPSMADVRSAVFNLLDLANRCLTTAERGKTALTEKELTVFKEVAGALDLIVAAVPVPDTGTGKARTLRPAQTKLGMLRLRFDFLCNCAARQDPSERLDRELVEELLSAVEQEYPELGVSPEAAKAAMVLVRDRVCRRSGITPEDGWLIPEANWAAKGKSRNKPVHAAPISGELLREFVRGGSAPPARGD
jgi:hypothetical protein